MSEDLARERTLAERVAMTASCRDADALPKVACAGEVVVQGDGRRAQIMHNGLRVIADGYCGPWMTELIGKLRGHHEPQEECAFAAVLDLLSDDAKMVELGANWAYYTLWFLQGRPRRRAPIVEPDAAALARSRENLALNGLAAEALRGYVGRAYGELVKDFPDPPPPLDVAALLRTRGFVDLLHCDAQGAETELLEACETLFREDQVGWLFLSTHGAPITGDPLTHQKCLAQLRAFGAAIAAEHDVHESFSGDGLIVARFGAAAPALPKFSRNRYATSYWRNPLYDLAEARPAPDAAVKTVGHWSELKHASALGPAGTRLLSPVDAVLYPYLVKHGRWHTEPLDLAREKLNPSASYTLVDVGANIGLFTRQFLNAFPAIDRAVCVEPDARNLEALKLNLADFADRGIDIHPLALSTSDGMETFYRDADNIGNYSLNADAMRNRRFEAARTRTRDAAAWAAETLAGDGRLIFKTDTQGSDEAIVARLPLSLWARVDFACFEIWRIEKPEFDEAAFAAVVDSFPHRSFRGVENPPLSEILDYARGRDWLFYDLYLWR